MLARSSAFSERKVAPIVREYETRMRSKELRCLPTVDRLAEVHLHRDRYLDALVTSAETIRRARARTLGPLAPVLSGARWATRQTDGTTCARRKGLLSIDFHSDETRSGPCSCSWIQGRQGTTGRRRK